MSDIIAATEPPAPATRFHRAKQWGSLLAKFLSVQVLVQALGLTAGIVLVRALSQREYAFFTLANTMQSTLLMLADIGIGTALLSGGGRVWQDRRRFGELIQTGLQVRRSLAIFSALAAVPILLWLLTSHGDPWLSALLLSVAVLLGVPFRLTNDVLMVVPRLHTQIARLQKLDLYAAVARLAMTLLAAIVFINAAVGMLAASLAFGLQTRLLRRWAGEGADLTAPVNADDRRDIVAMIRQQAPNTVYYCIQSQLTVFLISLFGATRTIAEVGALGRIAVVFTLINVMLGNVVYPRFARCQDKHRLIRMYWQILGANALLFGVILAAVAIFPKPLLWLLGRNYQHLQHELVYVVLSALVTTFAGVVYSLNMSRGWMRGSWVSIPLTIGIQAALIPFLNLGAIPSVVLLNCVSSAVGMIPFLWRAQISLREFQSAPLPNASI